MTVPLAQRSTRTWNALLTLTCIGMLRHPRARSSHIAMLSVFASVAKLSLFACFTALHEVAHYQMRTASAVSGTWRFAATAIYISQILSSVPAG